MRNYKLFGKIPIFDIVVVVVLIAVAFLGFKVFMSSKTGQTVTETQYKTIRYTVEFQNLSKMVDGLPEAGEKVRYEKTNSDIGVVVSSESKPYEVSTPNLITGERVTSVYEDRQNVEVVIEATASVSDKGISVNGVYFGMGRSFTILMPSISGQAYVKNIEIVEV